METYWNETLEVGIPGLDSGCQKLFEILASYDKAVSRGLAQTAVVELMEFLQKFVNSHFPAEEAVLKEHQYPEYPIHAAQHKYLANKLAAYGKKSPDEPNFTQGVHRDLVNWMLDHVTKSDKAWIKFVREKNKAAQAKLSQERRKCRHCSHENELGAGTCSSCGKSLSA